jgi:hypothetical protein
MFSITFRDETENRTFTLPDTYASLRKASNVATAGLIEQGYDSVVIHDIRDGIERRKYVRTAGTVTLVSDIL